MRQPIKHGRLGLRAGGDFYGALIGKQANKVITSSNFWVQVIKAKYMNTYTKYASSIWKCCHYFYTESNLKRDGNLGMGSQSASAHLLLELEITLSSGFW